MLPHFLNSDDKFPLYAGNSLYSIVLANLPVTINRFGQSAGNQKNNLGSSETKRGLSEQWLNWLTGFIEASPATFHVAGEVKGRLHRPFADGSFPNEKDNTVSFYISQSVKNAPLIIALKFWLGFGKIRWQHSERMIHFIVEDIPNIVILINLINGRLRTELKHEAFVKLTNRLNNKKHLKDNKIIIKPLNTKIDYDWLAGFTEGDGSFFIGLGNTPRSKLGVQITLNISWTQKSKKTLEFIAQEFKGAWSYNQTYKFWVYTIKRQSDVKKLLFSVFPNKFYGIKRYDFIDLKLACELFKTKKHLTESGLKILLEIKSKINSRRTF